MCTAQMHQGCAEAGFCYISDDLLGLGVVLYNIIFNPIFIVLQNVNQPLMTFGFVTCKFWFKY